jgi:hypothetical protein
MSLLFIHSGWDKLLAPAATQAMLASHHLPMVTFGWILAVVAELTGGLAILLGLFTRPVGPTRRAISLSPTHAAVKRSTSRTWRIVVLSAGIRSPLQKPKERTLIGPAEAPPNRATSSRNTGRNHLGTPSEIKSEWWRHHRGFAGAIRSALDSYVVQCSETDASSQNTARHSASA